jgi:hypothetical protein
VGIMSEIIRKTEGNTRSCEHRRAVDSLWIDHGAQNRAPVLFLDVFEAGPVILTLTNQTIYVRCPACHAALSTSGGLQ